MQTPQTTDHRVCPTTIFLLLLALPAALAILQGCGSNKLFYPVKVQSHYGYINYKGDLSIPPKYPNVQRYSEGFAPVQRDDGSLAYLDLKGEEREITDDYGEPEKLDIISDGMARVVIDGLVGYVDKQLKWAIEPQFSHAGRFSEGLAAILDIDQQRAWYIDKKGLKVFSLENVHSVGPMQGGFAYFIRDERFGIIDREGKVTREPSFLFLASADPISGLARALDDKTELYGFVNRDGSWIVSPRYPNAGDFSNGLAAVMLRHKNRYGYIDTHGGLRVPGQYLAAGSFHEGFAWVRTDKGLRYIDKDGAWLSPLIFTYAYDFYEGLAAAGRGENNLYINTNGKVTWSNR
ncbi:WG repeat-containing protein [Candidatus Haliotispira prima]|uniref:WG repeat-containing protein n=1 Tax=Candidatus Haliotispira prima TaxID=3034016 RepID=A0ABY8MM04_9SPIO|nr:WG repeat-containing protein [Candidatus Haliotispira prima]